ncbi:MAG: EamA family transporter [Spirochaetia bacterium]|nr:EamA family transporter [Spirochaetia bacterium]
MYSKLASAHTFLYTPAIMHKNYIKAIIACLLWSTAFAGVKVGLQYASPLYFAGIRFFIAGIIVLIISGNPSGLIPFLKEHWALALLVGSLQTSIMYGLYFNGINLLPAGIAAIIVGAGPLISAITAHFTLHDDRLNAQKVVSLTVALAGVVLISLGRNTSTAAGRTELLGILLLLSSSMMNAFSQVIVKKNPVDPMMLNASQILIGGIMLLIASFFIEGIPSLALPAVFYIALIWLSAVSGFSFSIWYTLLQKPEIKVSEINIFKFIIPVSGALLSWIIFPAEDPDLLSVIGMIIIASSVIIFYARRR